MAQSAPRNLSPYFHHASAFGLSGRLDRPSQQTVPTLASVTLATGGGHNTDRVDNYQLPGIVSFGAAYVDVGGSLDEPNNTHATYASSVIEDLNIFNVITADRVVSRLTIYHPAEPKSIDDAEPNFSILGSHFDNLRIAGEKIDVPLDFATFHDSTYKKFCGGGGGNGGGANAKTPRNSLMGVNLNIESLRESLGPADHNYDIVNNISKRFTEWDNKQTQPAEGHHFWCSATNYLVPPPEPAPKNGKNGKKEKNGQKGKNAKATTSSEAVTSPPPSISPTGLINFGGIICVPRFGVVYLAEVHLYQHHRYLTMIRVHMCSPGSGSITGGGTGGGGGSMPPP